MATLKTYGMGDVGTRLEHLADLQDLWSMGLEILTKGTYHTDHEIAQAADLEVALKLLENHMLSDFNPTMYARMINNLPRRAEDIQENDKPNTKE